VSESGSGEIEERIARLEQQGQQIAQALELVARPEAAPAAKAGRDWDAYAAVIASFIGLLALAVSGYTAYVQRQQLRAQVWPRVQLAYSGVELTFKALNQGTGPARITAMRVAVGGVPVRTWTDVERAAGYDRKGLTSSWLTRAVLSPGNDFIVIRSLDDEESRARFRELLPGGKHVLSITVCYCSVLDDCWVTAVGGENDRNADPRDSCTIPAAERFEQ
jgi:hypothetical protein